MARNALYINLLLAWLSFMVISCSSKDDLSSFKSENTEFHNQRINTGIVNQEHWVNDPVLITHKLFTYYETPNYMNLQLQKIAQDTVIVTYTIEGPYDDSVEGEKRIIKFIKINSIWSIDEIKVGYKCWDYRGGHTNYSDLPCP